jgi:hypothetical protein
MASPDEPAQVAKAAAVVRGQLTGRLVGGSLSPKGIVRIPNAYANLGILTLCYQTRPAVPASCAPKYHASNSTTSDTIYNARYQPLYYAIVGLPTLLTHSVMDLYLMRLLSAGLSAVFLALAVMAVVMWSQSRLLLGGVIMASTPSVLFFAGMVNPIGLETSTAICLWTSILILVCERLRAPPKGLIALVAFAAGMESLTRSISPLWVFLTFVIAVGLNNIEHVTKLLRKTSVRLGITCVSICSLIATAWIVALHSTDVLALGFPINKPEGNWSIFVQALKRTTLYYKEAISFFGTLNVPSPTIVYIGWAAMLGLLCLLALYYGNWRRRFALVVLLLAVIFLPALISASQARRLGIVWQGSDILPLLVGVPILAVTIIANSSAVSTRLVRRLTVPIVALIAGALTVIAFFAELRRYAVGIFGPDFSIFHSAWRPPIDIAGIFAVEILTVTMLIILFILLESSAPKDEFYNSSKGHY